jgi:mRNA interferase MazF
MSGAEFLPEAGDLVWTDFTSVLGRQQAGRHPALAVSPRAFVLNTGFVFVCPIIYRIRPFLPTSVVLPDGLPIAGEILISHLRSIDIQARPIHPVGAAVSPETARQVRAKLAALIAI